MSHAKQFVEEMAKFPDDIDMSNEIAAKYSYKVVKFKKYNDRRGLRFEDGSKLFFGEKEGTLELPVGW